jgi:predicted SnoaL-like aldol condensation-catalyzing enzyme
MNYIMLLICTGLIFSQQKTLNEISKETKEIAESYIKVYASLDFEKLSTFHNSESIWHDPTAEDLWGMKAQKGKTQILQYLKKAYENAISMELKIIRSFFSGSYAIYETNMLYKTKKGQKEITIKELPVNFHFKIKDGKVIEHFDFADYTVFLPQYQNQ